MTRLAVICLPDLVFAMPTLEDMGNSKETQLVPTRSLIKGNGNPMWLILTSEELVTGSPDYNRLKSILSFGMTDRDGSDSWYMKRVQTVITSAFRNLELDPNFKDTKKDNKKKEK